MTNNATLHSQTTAHLVYVQEQIDFVRDSLDFGTPGEQITAMLRLATAVEDLEDDACLSMLSHGRLLIDAAIMMTAAYVGSHILD